jgi:hypothetical protein
VSFNNFNKRYGFLSDPCRGRYLRRYRGDGLGETVVGQADAQRVAAIEASFGGDGILVAPEAKRGVGDSVSKCLAILWRLITRPTRKAILSVPRRARLDHGRHEHRGHQIAPRRGRGVDQLRQTQFMCALLTGTLQFFCIVTHSPSRCVAIALRPASIELTRIELRSAFPDHRR